MILVTEFVDHSDAFEQLEMVVLHTLDDDGDAAALEVGDDLSERVRPRRVEHPEVRHPDDHNTHRGVGVCAGRDRRRDAFCRTEEHRSVESEQCDRVVARLCWTG